MGPLMPVIQEILSSLSPVELRNEVIQALVPEIDRVIRQRAQQNPHAMQEPLRKSYRGLLSQKFSATRNKLLTPLAQKWGQRFIGRFN